MGNVTDKPPHFGHNIVYVCSGTWEYKAALEDGNLRVDWSSMNVLELEESNPWCDTCGRPLYGEPEDGLSEEWEAL